jgi:uncharacterized protein YegP (UPF0339 family)
MAFLIYLDPSGEWRWQLIAPGNRLIANSGQGYSEKQDCFNAVCLLKSLGETQILWVHC